MMPGTLIYNPNQDVITDPQGIHKTNHDSSSKSLIISKHTVLQRINPNA